MASTLYHLVGAIVALRDHASSGEEPSVETAEPAGNHYVTRTPFMYFETQLDSQLVLAGVTYHHLTLADGVLRIRMKKIELVNCDAALPSIQLLL